MTTPVTVDRTPAWTQTNPFYLPLDKPAFRPVYIPLIVLCIQLVLLISRCGFNPAHLVFYVGILVSGVSIWQRVEPAAGDPDQAERGEVKASEAEAKAELKPEPAPAPAAKAASKEEQEGAAHHQEASDRKDMRHARVVWWALWAVNVAVLGPQMIVAWRPLARFLWAKYVAGDVQAFFNRLADEQATC